MIEWRVYRPFIDGEAPGYLIWGNRIIEGRWRNRDDAHRHAWLLKIVGYDPIIVRVRHTTPARKQRSRR